MKLRILLGILVFLVIVNIAAVDTYLYYHMVVKPTETLTPRNDTIDDGGKPLQTLNNVQREELRDMMDDFKFATGELYGRIKILDDEILMLLQEDTIPKEKIESSLKEIMGLRMEINKMAIDKIIKTKSVLNKEQQAKLFSAIFRTKPRITSTNKNDGEKNKRVPNAESGKRPIASSDNQIKKYTELLDLDSEQAGKLKAIVEESQKKYADLNKKGISDPSEYAEAEKAIKDMEDASVVSILNGKQREIFVNMKQGGKERRNMMKEEAPGRKR